MKEPQIKGRRRVDILACLNGNELFKMQIFEAKCFKEWVTVNVTTNRGYAYGWSQERTLSSTKCFIEVKTNYLDSLKGCVVRWLRIVLTNSEL